MLSSSIYSLFYTLLNRCLLPLLRVVYGFLYSPYWWGSCIYTHKGSMEKSSSLQQHMSLFRFAHILTALSAFWSTPSTIASMCVPVRNVILKQRKRHVAPTCKRRKERVISSSSSNPDRDWASWVCLWDAKWFRRLWMEERARKEQDPFLPLPQRL